MENIESKFEKKPGKKFETGNILSLATIVSPLAGVAVYALIAAPNYERMDCWGLLKNNVGNFSKNVFYERNGFHYDLNAKLPEDTASFEDYCREVSGE